MSLRPRLAGDGRLRLPTRLAVVPESSVGFRQGEIVGMLGDDDYDPFERVYSGLFLSEEFARIDLSEPEVAVAWHTIHGMADVASFFSDLRAGGALSRPATGLLDVPADVLDEQHNVGWHLHSLARLSDHLPARGVTPTGTPEGWQERWAQPALRAGNGLLWLGGGEDGRRIVWDATRSTQPDGEIPSDAGGIEDVETWREGRALSETILREDVPVLTLPGRIGTTTIASLTSTATLFLDREAIAGATRHLTEGLGSGWWDLVELQRRLMEPYVRRAVDHQVEIGWPSVEDAAPDTGETSTARSHGPLVVRERRRWDSLLAPLYLQLFEALRRVTEGQRGAAFCKECGRPFLTLDARRSVFCTDRERSRYGQRERRKRLAGADGAKIEP